MASDKGGGSGEAERGRVAKRAREGVSVKPKEE